MADPIVVGVDGSGRSLRALTWAAHEATLHRRALRVVHVLPREHEYGVSRPGRDWLEHRSDQGIVDEAASIAQEAHPDLEVTSDLPMGAPAVVLLSEAEHAHMIVLGAKGLGGFGSLLLGSVALQVVGHSASPVVIVNHATMGHRRVVVGADGSPHSLEALAHAFQEASLRGAKLHVLHAWSGAVTGSDRDRAAEEQQHAMAQWLAPLRQEHPAVEVLEDLTAQSPVPALARASDRADLMVVGSRGRGGFHGLALGSVSHALLQFSQCPLMVVRPRP